MMPVKARIPLVVLWLSGAAAAADRPPADAVLPPTPVWNGSSRDLALPPDAEWATPFEISGMRETPRYGETMAWLDRLAQASPVLNVVTVGRSHEGREIRMVVASTSGSADPETLRADGKPVVLIHAGIHAGEIDGKDAGMMLLRDMTVRGTRGDLLERVHVLFIPILSVDGHERWSDHGRINQRGPEQMGWRTNARNQNLNRDFSKLDTPEVRALAATVLRYQPDLYVDVHVTDGADWQYDVTWGYNGEHAHSPRTARWLERTLDPVVTKALREAGHVPGPLFFPVDGRDMGRGVVRWTAGPRFSNGWGDARHLPTILVENHSLKPFDRRVLGTRVFLESVLGVVGSQGDALRRAAASDAARRPASIPLSWGVPPDAEPARGELLAVEQNVVPSAVSGALRVEWTGEPVRLEVPWLTMSHALSTAVPPQAYWVPAAWGEVIERLRHHGIRMETIDAPRKIAVEMYRLEEPTIEASPFEGRVRASARPVAERRTETFAPGSVRVPVDQPLGTLAVLLLEPASPDSFFQWGFFLEVLQRTEYFEAYVMEPTAERMLESDPELAAGFRRKLSEDPEFASDARARLEWFYRRTPYFDERFRLYPVARETAAE